MSLSTPTVLGGATSTSSATSLASASVSPSSDCLLIVAARASGDQSASIAVASTTLSNVGTWNSVRDYAGSSNGGTVLLAWALVTGAPGTGTVTVSWAGAGSNSAIQVIEITGHNTTAPVAQSKVGTGSNPFTSLSLTSTPASTSTVIGALAAQTTNAPTAGSLFTSLQVDTMTTTRRLATEYDAASAGTTVDWGNTSGGTGIGAAIEIAEAATATFVPSISFF